MYEIFKKELDRIGKKPADICKATGIPASTFSDWKKGKSKPGPDKLLKIAEFLGVSVKFLMTGQEESNEEAIEAKTPIEKELLLLCRKVSDAPDQDKEMIVNQFKSSIEMYLKFKGIKGE